ncbi:MAG: hypothetical protein HY800_02065 [Ignavibacteriales bacterium]|nr:hypothetical protein [Ignavibacteriales bacterium]
MDFQYEVSLKNLDPVSSLLGEIPFNAQAHLKGTIENRDRNLSFTCDGIIDEFYVGTIKGGVPLNKARLICRADSLNMFEPLERLSMTMDLTVDSGLINTQNLDDINLSFGFDHHKGKLSGYGTFDSTYSLNINGEISVQPNTYVFDLDSLVFSANNSIWKNDQDVQLRLNYDGLRIMHAAFKRNHETISISGALLHSGDLSLSAIGRRLSLSGLSDIFQGRTLSSQGEGFSGSANIDVHLTGSTASPIIKLNAIGENVYFRKTKIGQLTADFDYADQIASINANVKESTTDTKPILTIDGTIPINLALTKVDRLFPEKYQSLELKSDGFNVGILDPLLKDFDNLTLLKISISIHSI